MRALRARVSSKIGLAVAGLVALVAIGQWVVFRGTMELYGHDIRARLVRPGIALVAALARSIGPDEARLRRELGDVEGFTVALYDHDGRVLARSHADVAAHALGADVRARADAAPGEMILLGAANLDAPTAAIAAVEDGGRVAYVGLFDQGAAATILAVRLRAAMGMMLMLSILALAVTGLIAAWIRRSIQRTQRVVAAIADGALDRRLPAAGDDEVGALVADFNRMSDRIEDLVGTLRDEQDRKRRLFAAFTHELNTPLTSVLGYLESLGMPDIDADPETRRRYVAIAHEQARALDALADDLETLSRIDLEGIGLERASVDLPAVVRAEIEAMSPRAADAGVAIELDAQPVLAEVDRRRIGQVLRNLIDNAIRHSPRGSAVHVAVRREESGPVLEVRDRGEGIAPEHLPHLGEPLWRADPSRTRGTGGRGLGLAIARAIVEAHGARMTIDSVLGEGTTVRVELAREPG